MTSNGAGGSYSLEVEERGVNLFGTARRDRLRCGGQPNHDRARAGNDIIVWGAGDDMISGGGGRDVQRGGAGADLVEFASRLRGTPRCVPGRTITFRSGRARFEIRNLERSTFAGKDC